MKFSNILALSATITEAFASHNHINNTHAMEFSNISKSLSSEDIHSRQILEPSHLTSANTTTTTTTSRKLRAGSPVVRSASCTTNNEALSTSDIVLLEVLFDEMVSDSQTTYADWLIAYLSKLTSDIYAIANDSINLSGLSFTSSFESVDAIGILKLASDVPLYTCYLSSIFEAATATPYTINDGLTPEENGKLVALFQKRGDTANYGYNLADDVEVLVSQMNQVAKAVATATDLSYTSYFSLLNVDEVFSIASDAPIYNEGLSYAFSSALSEFNSQSTIKVTTTKNFTVTHSLLDYHVSVTIPSTVASTPSTEASVPHTSHITSTDGGVTSYVYNTSTLDETTTITSCSLESDASQIELEHQVHTVTTLVTVTVCDEECETLHSLATAAIRTTTVTGTTTVIEEGKTVESAIAETVTTCDEECQSKASAAMSAISTIVSTVTSTITEVQTLTAGLRSDAMSKVYTVTEEDAHASAVTPSQIAVHLVHKVLTDTSIFTVTVCDKECETLHSLATAAIRTTTVTSTTTVIEEGKTVESTITETVTTCDEECQSKASAAMSAISTIVSTVTSTITEEEGSATTLHQAVTIPASAYRAVNTEVVVSTKTTMTTETLVTTMTVCEGDCQSLKSVASEAVRTITVTSTTTVVEEGKAVESTITKTVTTCDEECQSKASAASYLVSTIVSTYVSTFVSTITEGVNSPVASHPVTAVVASAYRAVNTEVVVSTKTTMTTETLATTMTVCEGDCQSLKSVASEAVRTITVTSTTTVVEEGKAVESTITKTVTTCDEECQSKASAASYLVSTIVSTYVSTFVFTITEDESSATTLHQAVTIPASAYRAVNTEVVVSTKTAMTTETLVTTMTVCEGDCQSLKSVASEAVRTITVTSTTTVVEEGKAVESTITKTVTTCDEECQSKASAASYLVSTIVSTYVSTFVSTITEGVNSPVASHPATVVAASAQLSEKADRTSVTTMTVCEGDCQSLQSAASRAIKTVTISGTTTIVNNGSTVESVTTETITTCDEECQSKASAASYLVSTIVSAYVVAETIRESSTIAAVATTTDGVTTTSSSQTTGSVSHLRATMNNSVVTISICDEECESIRRAAASAIATVTLASTVESVANGSTLKSVTTEVQTTCDAECESKVSEAKNAVKTSLSTMKQAVDPDATHVTTTLAQAKGATVVAATDANAAEHGTTAERADDKEETHRATVAAQATPAAYSHSTSHIASARAQPTVSVSAQVENGAARGSISNTWIALMAALVLLI